MGYKVMLNGEPTSLDLPNLPETQSDLEHQLRKLYPGCYIDLFNWPGYKEMSEDGRIAHLERLYDGKIRLYATSMSSWGPDSTGRSDMKLWKSRKCNEVCPQGPASELLKGDHPHLPILWTADAATVAVALPKGRETIMPIYDHMIAGDLVTAVAEKAGVDSEHWLFRNADLTSGKRIVPIFKDLTLIEQRIFPGIKLKFAPLSPKSPVFKVIIRPTADKTQVIPATSDMRVGALLEEIKGYDLIPTGQEHRLFCGFMRLEPRRRLMDYDIIDSEIIDCFPEAIGGMFHATSGRKDFEPLNAVGEIIAKGGISLEIVLPDCSVLVMEVSEGDSIPDIKARIAAMLCEREAKELAAMDVDCISDVNVMRRMLRAAQGRIKELERKKP